LVVNRLPVIGITCYPSAGGSGIVASELGLNLARRGYEVHFITDAMPVRLRRYERNIFFHQVEAVSYPVFRHTPYTLALATKMCEVARHHGLDILHVHYAIPHAASAFLARSMLGPGAISMITTLHGTDITLVGQEPSYFEMTRFLIAESDAVTAVSSSLKEETRRVFGVGDDIEVIPNFIDPRRFRPSDALRREDYASSEEALLIHASNFRPVKNIPHVLRVFARVNAARPSRLLLLGEGPERRPAEKLADELGVRDRIAFLGHVENLEDLISVADLMLMPSRHESFGLVALESMACGTPVIVTSVGGAEEFIESGHNSYRLPPDDLEAWVATALDLLGNDALYRQIADDGLRDAVSRFGTPCVIKSYVDLYDRVLADRT
jgi:L-malate glycosyltransferase